MGISLYTKDSLVDALKNTAIMGGVDTPFVEAIGESSMSADSYFFNSTYNTLRIKNNSNSVKGSLSVKLGYLPYGQVTKVSCEVCSISGVKPKFAIDFLSSDKYKTNTERIGVSEIYQGGKANEFETIDLEIIHNHSGYGVLVIGLFTSDVGEFYIRNIKIETTGEKLVKSFRVYNFKGNVIQNDYGYDTATANVNSSERMITLTHDVPFGANKKTISFISVSASDGNNVKYEVRARSDSNKGLIIRILDRDTKQYVDPNIIGEYFWYSVLCVGYDYA